MPVLIVGAGQAGLAAAYHLRQAGSDFLVVDAADAIGDSWRNRYDSLTLFTPRRFSTLPGMPLAGDPDGYPSRDEFAAYLAEYANRFGLAVRLGQRVLRLERREGRDGFVANLSTGEKLEADRVIVATGAFQLPVVPPIAAGLSSDVFQLTGSAYKRPTQIPAGQVLVVGDGATGRDIAAELAASRKVLLSTGKPRRLLPEHLLGRSTWWWLSRLGLMRVSPNSPIGRAMKRADPFPNRGRAFEDLRSLGVEVLPRLVQCTGRSVLFENGDSRAISSIVWSAGYRDDWSWLAIPEGKDGAGQARHAGGLSPVPHLYFLGRPWQRNRASALVMGAGPDAAAICAEIKHRSS